MPDLENAIAGICASKRINPSATDRRRETFVNEILEYEMEKVGTI